MGRVTWLLAACGAALALAAGAGAGPSATAGVIVFPATPQGQTVTQLFAVQPTGAGLKQLTTGANPALNPALSPAGTRLAFARFGVGIFVMNLDGSGLRRLTKNGRDAYPTWSTDGRRLAFVRPVGSAWRLYVMSSSGGKATRLRQAPPAGRPSWTRQGLLVPTGGDLIRVDPTTGRVLKYYDANIDAIWGLNSVGISPSVAQLTYVGAREPVPGDMECGDGPCQRYGLYLENLSGKNKKPRMIVKDAGPAAFSPDGKRIAFVAGGALELRSLATGATTTVPTENLTPVGTGPAAWH